MANLTLLEAIGTGMAGPAARSDFDREVDAVFALWLQAVEATNMAAAAEAESQRAQAAHNSALHRLHAKYHVPPGKGVDVLGDRKVKPSEQLAKDISR
jgi:hypothetical protein